jgi:hypothetical protein
MRIVLDTNGIVSGLLFSGTASRLAPLWQSRRIIVLISKTQDRKVRACAPEGSAGAARSGHTGARPRALLR